MPELEHRWWRTHPVMAWPQGRLIHVADGRVQILDADGSWSTIPDCTTPPVGAQPVTDFDADQEAAQLRAAMEDHDADA